MCQNRVGLQKKKSPVVKTSLVAMFAGIDVGGTKILAVILDEGKVIGRCKVLFFFIFYQLVYCHGVFFLFSSCRSKLEIPRDLRK